jgi:hypothetical protein
MMRVAQNEDHGDDYDGDDGDEEEEVIQAPR